MRCGTAVLLTIGSVLCATPVAAQPVEEFYKSKQIRIVDSEGLARV